MTHALSKKYFITHKNNNEKDTLVQQIVPLVSKDGNKHAIFLLGNIIFSNNTRKPYLMIFYFSFYLYKFSPRYKNDFLASYFLF